MSHFSSAPVQCNQSLCSHYCMRRLHHGIHMAIYIHRDSRTQYNDGPIASESNKPSRQVLPAHGADEFKENTGPGVWFIDLVSDGE